MKVQSATYSVVLTEEPDGDVTVSLYSSSSSALRVSTSSLTFTKDDYDTSQDVTITALVMIRMPRTNWLMFTTRSWSVGVTTKWRGSGLSLTTLFSPALTLSDSYTQRQRG